MYNTENPYKSAGEYLKAPLFEKYQLRRAAVKTSTALFPFMLFAAIFAFIILILGKVFPSLLDGLYWVSYMSVQLFRHRYVDMYGVLRGRIFLRSRLGRSRSVFRSLLHPGRGR